MVAEPLLLSKRNKIFHSSVHYLLGIQGIRNEWQKANFRHA